jgi:hypothetical protein
MFVSYDVTAVNCVLNASRSVYSRPVDETLGYRDDNGTWLGTVGALVRKEAEVAINLLAMTTERLDAVDFLPPILNDR